MPIKLLLVVGAGASGEFGLPIGAELKTAIASLLWIRFDVTRIESGDIRIVDALRDHVRHREATLDINPYLHEAWHIVEAMPQASSIDSFIDAHRGNKRLELCGKLGIVRAILDAERNSNLYFNPHEAANPDFRNSADSWGNAFFQILVDGASLDQIPERLLSIAIICFNYDRCIEHYLFHAFKNYYRINNSQVTALMANLKIFHPYGTVGSLPWQDLPHAMSFGDLPHPTQLLELASQIKTFTEGTDPGSSDILEIRALIASSPMILWLGFAFHLQNLGLLMPSAAALPRDCTCFGTTFGVSDHNRGAIIRDLSGLLGTDTSKVTLHSDRKCAPLIREYSRAIALR